MGGKYILELSGSKSSTIASVKLAKFITTFRKDIEVTTPEKAKETGMGPKADLVIIPNLPKLCIKNVHDWYTLITEARKVIWLQNDYAIWSPHPGMDCQSMFYDAFQYRVDKGRRTEVWTTCEDDKDKYGDMFVYANWNAASFHGDPVRRSRTPKDGILYYGAFREGREKYFDAYFGDTRHSQQFVISTTERAQAKFLDRYPYVDMIDKLENPAANGYDAALYIQDKSSAKKYHSPATRIYEMLLARNRVFVDADAAATLERGGFFVSDKEVVCNAETAYEAYNLLKWSATRWERWATVASKHLSDLVLQVRSMK